MILRARRAPDSEVDPAPGVDLDVHHHGLIGFRVGDDLVRLRADASQPADGGSRLSVRLRRVDDQGGDDHGGDDHGGESGSGARGEVVVVGGAASPADRFALIDHWSAVDVVGFEVDPTEGPPGALVTIAMVAGARVLLLGEDAEQSGLAREVRRSADLAEALLIERDAVHCRSGAVPA